MEYIANYNSIDTFIDSIESETNQWLDDLLAISEAVASLQQSENISGMAADNMRSYLQCVHGSIIDGLYNLVLAHYNNCLVYRQDYRNIDGNDDAIIIKQSLETIRQNVNTNKNKAVYICGEIDDALNRIRDIFVINLNDNRLRDVEDSHAAIAEFTNTLDEKIIALEDRHYANDFINTESLRKSISSFIDEYNNKGKYFKRDFDVEKFFYSDTMDKLFYSYNDLATEQFEKEGFIEEAVKFNSERVKADREQTAKLINGVTTGVCIIGSAFIIVFSGGTGTTVAFTLSGAITSGVSNLTAQYVEHGNILENSEDIKWGQALGACVLGGVEGYITGGVGGKITSHTTKYLGGKITSRLGRAGAFTFVGGTTDFGTGIAARSISGFFLDENKKDEKFFSKEWWEDGFDNAKKRAFDKSRMVSDFALGAGGQLFDTVTTLKNQKAADDFVAAYNAEHNVFQNAQDMGLEGINKTSGGAIDFASSDYILRTETNEPVQLKMELTGNYAGDYKKAQKILKDKYNIDLDFATDDNIYKLYYLDDYDAITGKATIQFVEADVKASLSKQANSLNQYVSIKESGYNSRNKNYFGEHLEETVEKAVEGTIKEFMRSSIEKPEEIYRYNTGKEN